MDALIAQLKEIIAEGMDLYNAAQVLEWDQQVNMPEGGSDSRSYQMSALQKLSHERLSSPQLGELLAKLEVGLNDLDPDSDDARLIQVTRRKYDKRVKVPARLVSEFYEVVGRGHVIWLQARAENNFAKFQPTLERIVELRRQFASCFQPYDHPYDPLLDDYEPEIKTAEVKAIFDALRPQQVELIRQIASKPAIDNSVLHQPFDPATQWDFANKVITDLGYDWEHGRVDKSAHPFTINFGRDDVRITNRVEPNFFNTCFFAGLHETGHALYELGSAPALERTTISGGASLGMHESQSRMWENLVGRSLPFWRHYYPLAQQAFPAQLANVDILDFYKAINRVSPSLIRIEADEATYNLHIMLRLEIEMGLIDGSISVKDLPAIWNALMSEYLGLTPPNDAKGVLQDVHWSGGMIGYFATYALGNLISAQLWETILREIPDIYDQISRGKFSALLAWLRDKIHRHGAKYTSQTLVERITGSRIDPAPYMRYLRSKYTEIYEL